MPSITMSAFLVVVFELSMHADAARSGSYPATLSRELKIADTNQSAVLEAVKLSDLRASEHSDSASWKGESSGDSVYWRILSEMAGVFATAFVSITLANHWRGSSSGFGLRDRILKQVEPQKMHAAARDVAQQATEGDDACAVDKDSHVPSQAEAEWISAARSGGLRLTDDVYASAMEWWLKQPLSSTINHLTSLDQKLLAPVLALLQTGRQQEASMLLEQIGHLDRLERQLRQSRATTDSPASKLSPLSRTSTDVASSATRLRRAIESYGTVTHTRIDTHRFDTGQSIFGDQSQSGVCSTNAVKSHQVWQTGIAVPPQTHHFNSRHFVLPQERKYGCGCGA